MKIGDLKEGFEAELVTLLERFAGQPNTEEVRQEILSVICEHTKACIEEYQPLNTKLKEGEIKRLIDSILGVGDDKN